MNLGIVIQAERLKDFEELIKAKEIQPKNSRLIQFESNEI